MARALYAGSDIQACDPNGDPYSGAKLYAYLTATTTPSSMYTAATAGTTHANPLVADSAGRFPDIFLDVDITYRMKLTNAAGSDTIYDFDPVTVGVNSGYVTYAALADTSPSGASLVVLESGDTVQEAFDGLFSGIFADFGGSPPAIPLAVLRVTTNGFGSVGVGAAWYTYDGTVNGAYVAANPLISFLDSLGRGWKLSRDQRLSPKMFGAIGDGAADDYDAFLAAHNFMGPDGGTVYIPAGFYRLSETIDNHFNIIWQGEGNATRYNNQVIGFSQNGLGTVILMDSGKRAFVLNANNTEGDATVAAGTYEAGPFSALRDMYIRTQGGGSGIDGIYMRATAEINNVTCRGFTGHGLRIESVSGGGTNLWRVDRFTALVNGGDGIFVDGGDANAGLLTLCDCTLNSGWGIRDLSLIGNTYIAPHAANNTLGSYKTDDTAPNTFIGAYIEIGGTGDNTEFGDTTTVEGNLAGQSVAVPVDTRAWSMTAGLAVGASLRHLNRQGDGLGGGVDIVGAVGSLQPDHAAFKWGSGDDSDTYDSFRLVYDPGTQFWQVLSVISSKVILEFPADMAGFRADGPNFPNGCFIGGKFRGVGTTAPVAGTWLQGDHVANSVAQVGQPVGWFCTIGGTPGTWVAEAVL